MASIKKYYLKKSKDYRYEVYVSNGIDPGTKLQRKIHKKGFKSFEEAEKFAKIIEGQIASEEYIQNNPKKLTIEKFMDDWINNYKMNVKEGTRIVHRANIKMYINPYIGNYKLDKYTRADHQRFINQLLTKKGLGRTKEGLSVTTAKSINATLSNAFKKAIQLGYIKNNPTSFVEFPRNLSDKKKVKYYTFDQSELFLEFAKKEKSFIWYPFFLIIFDQGLRKSEVLGLQWADIDFSQNTLNINRERLGAAEKGPNKGLIITDDTKTPSGTRSLPMTKRVKKALLTLRNQVIKKFGFLPETDDHEAFIFINTYGKNKGIPIRDRTVNGASHRIEKRANLPHITVHDGRHTFAARTRQAGIPLEDIKDFLGHKDVSTTQVYAHISPEVKKRSMNQLENYIEEQIKKHSN